MYQPRAHRVLLLMSNTGGGHRSAAEALSVQLKALASSDDINVRIVDLFLDHSSFPLTMFPFLYGEVTRRSFYAWKLIFDCSNGALRTRIFMRLLSTLDLRHSTALVKSFEPTCIISVHPIITHLVAAATSKLGYHPPFYVVVTDLLNIHPAWVCEGVDQFFVSTLAAAAKLGSYGVPKDKIRIAGAPVNPKFIKPNRPRQELRRELGLDPHLFTVLIVGGGEGTGEIYRYAQILNGSALELQAIVVAGRNFKLRRRLESIDYQIRVKIEGYVDNMPQLMHASDLIITRAGPGVVTEALAGGLPLLLTGFLPGQEEGIIEFVQTSGAGIRLRSSNDLAATLGELVKHHELTESMKEAAVRTLNPNGASVIAEDVLQRIDR